MTKYAHAQRGSAFEDRFPELAIVLKGKGRIKHSAYASHYQEIQGKSNEGPGIKPASLQLFASGGGNPPCGHPRVRIFASYAIGKRLRQHPSEVETNVTTMPDMRRGASLSQSVNRPGYAG